MTALVLAAHGSTSELVLDHSFSGGWHGSAKQTRAELTATRVRLRRTHATHVFMRVTALGGSALLRRRAAELSARNLVDEVAVAFHKQPPFFRDAFHELQSDEIIVVPFMTSAGYFSRTILPRAMGLTGPVTRRHGRTIRLTAPLGEHPRVTALIAGLVERTMQRHHLNPSETALVLVGHGTPRHPDSASAARRHAQLLRHRLPVQEVVAVFLDESPQVEQTYELTRAPNLVIVPYLIGESVHLVRDLPDRLSIPMQAQRFPPAPSRVRGRSVHLTASPFQDISIGDVIQDFVNEVREPVEAVAGRLD